MDSNQSVAHQSELALSQGPNHLLCFKALFDSPEQAAAKETLREMMRARLGDRHDLADRITPDFGVGCR